MLQSIKLFFTKSLKRELIIAIVLTHALMMSIFVFDLTRQQEIFLHKQSLSQVKSLARTLAKNSSVWVLSNDYAGMEDIIDSVSEYPGLVTAMLIDMDGKVLVSTNEKNVNKYLGNKGILEQLNSKIKTITIANDKNIIDIAMPIVINNKNIGWARVGLSQKENSEGIKKVLTKGIFYSIIAIFIGWIFAYILAIGFTKSLYKIISIAKKRARGKRGLQIDTSRSDEIGILSVEMNTMLKKLDDNDKKLSMFNESLQLQVEEKTKSLEEKNKKLQINEEELKNLNENLEIRIESEVKKNLETQEQLFKSEKMAAMGEMIGNIAHQWRQPLSVISTASTGMLMQKEYKSLSDEDFNKNCELINENAQYLSKTIDDFRNFIQGDRVKEIFNLEEKLHSFLRLVDASIKNHDINVVLDLEKDIEINGYKNELAQCLINIFNNAKDILVEKEVEHKFILITTKKENNKIIIKIKDNAGGIPEDILNKIFEPYFTTKHKSQGTGLGLHMAYKLIVEGMNGDIKANNVEFDYDGKHYTGAEFTISLFA